MRFIICVLLITFVFGCSDSNTPDNNVNNSSTNNSNNSGGIAGPEALPKPGDTEFFSLEPRSPCSGNVNNVNNFNSLQGPGACVSRAAAIWTGLRPKTTVAYVNGTGVRITNVDTGVSTVSAFEGCLTYAGSSDEHYIALLDGFRGIVDGQFINGEPAVVVASASALQPETKTTVLNLERVAGGIVEDGLLKVVGWDGAQTVLLEYQLGEQGIGEPSVVVLSDQQLLSAWIVGQKLVARFGEAFEACVVSGGPNSTCSGRYPTTTQKGYPSAGNDLIALRGQRVLTFTGDSEVSLFVEGDATPTSTLDFGAARAAATPPYLLDDFAVVLLESGGWMQFEISDQNQLENPQDLQGAPSLVVPLDENRLLSISDSAVLLEATSEGVAELAQVAVGFDARSVDLLSVETGAAVVALFERGNGHHAFVRVQANEVTLVPMPSVYRYSQAVRIEDDLYSMHSAGIALSNLGSDLGVVMEFDTSYSLARENDVVATGVLTRASAGGYESYIEVFDAQDIDTVLATIPLNLDNGALSPYSVPPPAALIMKGERLAVVGNRVFESDSQILEIWDLSIPSNPQQIAATTLEGAPLSLTEPLFFHGDYIIQRELAVSFEGEVTRFELDHAFDPIQMDGRFFLLTQRSAELGLVFELIEVSETLELAAPVNVPGQLIHLNGTTGVAFSNLTPGSAISVFELEGGIATLSKAGLLSGDVWASRVTSDGSGVLASGEELYSLEIDSMEPSVHGAATTQALQVVGDRWITTMQPEACTSGLRPVGYLSRDDDLFVNYHLAPHFVGFGQRPPALPIGNPMLAVDIWGQLQQW